MEYSSKQLVPEETTAITTIWTDDEMHKRSKTENIKTLVKECQTDVEYLKKLQDKIVVSDIQNQANDQQLTDAMHNFKLKTDTLRQEFKGLETHISQEEKDIQSDSTRIYASLLQSFVDTTKLWKSVQIQFQDHSKLRLRQHLQGCAASFSPQETDQMIQNGNFSACIQNSNATEEDHQNFISEAESRYEQIIKLDKSINHLRNLIAELSLIAKSQTQQTDDLEDDARLAAEICFDAEATHWRHAARTKRRSLFIITTVTFIIILILTYYFIFNHEDVEVPHASV